MNSYTTLTVNNTEGWTASIKIWKTFEGRDVSTDFYVDDVLQKSTGTTDGEFTISLSIASGTHVIKIDGGQFYFYGSRVLGNLDRNNYLTQIDFGSNYGTSLSGTVLAASSITSLFIPKTITNISSGGNGYIGGLLENCPNLTSIIVDPESTRYDSRDNCNAIIGKSTNKLVVGCKTTTIPNTVVTIGNNAFSECSGLTSIAIPSSVTSIGNSAFWKCSSLASITISNGVTSIGSATFSGCTALTSITIPNSVTSMGDSAFESCSSLTSIKCLGVTPPSLATSVFNNTNNCPIYVPYDGINAYKSATNWSNYASRITYMPDYEQDGIQYAIDTNNTYAKVIGYTSAILPQSTILSSITVSGMSYNVTQIANNAFSGCTTLTSITIPNSVMSIGGSAFRGCSNLTSVTIPDGVTSIAYEAFIGCSNLTSITIPSSVTSIDDAAFSNCSGLATIVVDTNNTVYDSRDNCNAIIKTSTNALITGCKNTVIPNTVTTIGISAFKGCTSLTSIIIPNSVTSIQSSAFRDCSGLTSVAVPNSVTGIGVSAFNSCTSLTLLTFEANSQLTSIGNNTFNSCSGLTLITIPSSVTNIGSDAFRNCSGLVSVTCQGTVPPTLNTHAFDNTNNCPIYVPYISVNSYKTATNWSSYSTRIFASADYVQDGIQYVITDSNYATVIGYTSDVLPQSTILSSITVDGNTYSVTSIGNNAFDNCTTLTSITMPSSVITVGAAAFGGCSNLTDIYVYGSKGISNYAFENCVNLSNFYISSIKDWFDSTINSTSGCPFYSSTAVTKNLYIIGDNSPKTTLTQQDFNNVSAIGNYLFYKFTGLTSVTIPNTVTSIGEYAFAYCSALSIISLPIGGISSISNSAFRETAISSITLEGITSISDNLFRGCPNLTSVTISNGITSIGQRVFQDCTHLTSITLPETLETISENTFTGCASMSVVYYNGTLKEWCGLNILTATASPFYASNAQNKSIYIDSYELTSISTPNDLTTIESYVFYNYDKLTTLTLNTALLSIKEDAFNGCSGLTAINCKSATPPILEADVFDNTNNCPINILYSWLDVYSSATNWKKYKARFVAIPVHYLGTSTISSITYGNLDVNIYYGNQILYKGIIPPVPAEGNFIKFVSDESFTLNVVDYTKYWDGIVEYSTTGSSWSEWDGTTTLSSSSDGKLYLRGTGNTKITGVPYSTTSATLSTHRWVFTGNADIAGSGNIENLLDYATVEAGNHPAMASGCFAYLFNDATIVSSPDLMATTLSQACYQSMYRGSLIVTAPVIAGRNENSGYQNSITIAPYCFRYMFQGCSSLKYLQSAFDLQAGSTPSSAFNSIFRNCTSLEDMPEIIGHSSTIASSVFQYIYYGCSNIKVSSTQTGEYVNAYNVKLTGTTTIKNALTNTGGTYTSTITPNRNYYTSNRIIKVYPTS